MKSSGVLRIWTQGTGLSHFGDLAQRIRLSSESSFANLQILELLSTFELVAPMNNAIHILVGGADVEARTHLFRASSLVISVLR